MRTIDCLVLVLALASTSAEASFIDLIPPADPDGDNGSGSLGSPAGFDPGLGPAGFVFDVIQDFDVTAVSVAMAVQGQVEVSAAIRDSSGAVLAETTQTVASSSDVFRPSDRINPSDSFEWYWFDIPLSFGFAAGTQYQLTFPFDQFSFVSGSYTRDPNNWLMVVPHFFDVEGRALTDPYVAQGTLTVVDGTLMGSRITGMPLAGMVTPTAGIPDVDRTFGFQPSSPPDSAPEPSTLFLLGAGIVGLVGYVRRRH